MSTADRTRLAAEKIAIEERLTAAPEGTARDILDAQFNQRLSHLRARLEQEPADPIPPAPTDPPAA